MILETQFAQNNVLNENLFCGFEIVKKKEMIDIDKFFEILVINLVDDEINNLDDDALIFVQFDSIDFNNRCIKCQNQFFSYQFISFIDVFIEVDDEFEQIINDQRV